LVYCGGGTVAEEKGDKLDPVTAFIKLYNNLPLDERKRVVLVFENEPISWEVARNEIIHKSPRGENILKKLIELKIV